MSEETKKNEQTEEAKEESAHYTKEPKIGGNGPSLIRQYFTRGTTYFLVIAAGLIFYFVLLRVSDLWGAVQDILYALRAVVYGCVIAYLLNPLVSKIEGFLMPRLGKRFQKEKTARNTCRGLSIFVSLLLIIALIVALVNRVVPEVVQSIQRMSSTLPGQINALLERFNAYFEADTTFRTAVVNVINQASEMLEEFLRTDLLPNANSIMYNLTAGVVGFVREAINVIVGLIVSIYLLMGKERFTRQCKKGIYAVFNARHANLILHIADKSNHIFSGFISGKIVDSLIIGVICFIVLSILNMPYTVLISVFIGVCNCIPFFGPIIGAVPSAILIILTNPIQGIYFIIFVLILQQFDGNILGPRILGNSTGLPSFWVIVAILLGGGLFGFIGMILGCPTFAVLYYIVRLILDNRLEQKNLPVGSGEYGPQSFVDSEGNYIRVEHVDVPQEEEK